MRKILFLLMAMPLLSFAQDKNVISTTRVFPKMDKIAQFEKALASHAQKFHKGDWSWRVYTVESGPEAGSYHIVEGPGTWEGIDKRGDLGKAHTDDWNMNVSPLLTDRSVIAYSVYRPDLSTIQLTDYSDKIAINHIFPKPGYGEELEQQVKLLKKVWEEGNQTIAVYEASSSGPAQLVLVTRYKQGLKERDPGFRKPMKDRYISVNGPDSWTAFQQGLRNNLDHSWTELLVYHKELSSK